MEVRPLQQSRHPLMHTPLQSQQLPLHHPQAAGGGPSPTPQPQRMQPFRQPLQQAQPLQQQQHYGLAPRPSAAFSGSRTPAHPAPPLIGQKRDSSGFAHGSSRSAETAEGVNFPKLFVGSVPRNISEDEIRRLFGEYGKVLEVALLRDKRTGLPQGCCFIKYATVEEAERAIGALHNKRMLPGGSAPLQVKFADSERDRQGRFADSERDRQVVGPAEQKLFVGSLNKQATEKEIEEIFAPYGRVDDVYIMRDEHKQSRGCAFVKFPARDMAVRAMSALNGLYRMPGCDQPIIVRFADPKRPRSGENSRMGGPGFDGPSFSPHSHPGVSGPRAAAGSTIGSRSPPFGWRAAGGPSGMGLLPQAGYRPLGTPMSNPLRGGTFDGPNPVVGVRLTSGSSQASPVSSGQVAGLGMLPQLSHHQGYSESQLQRPLQASGQQISLHQQPSQSFMQGISNQQQQQASTVQSQIVQSLQGFVSMQSADARLQQQNPSGNYPAAQTILHSYMQNPVSNHQVPQIPGSIQQPVAGLQSQQLQFQPSQQQGSQANQQPIELQPPQQLHQQLLAAQLHQFTGQAASQQTQPAQTSQAYIQAFQLASQPLVSSQPSWAAPVQQLGATSNAAATVATVPVPATATAALTCDWTEHTSPEGHKYYYNSSTGESRWEKPEEFAAFEQHQHQNQQQQQQQPAQQLHLQQQQQPAQQLQMQQQPQQQQQQQQQPQQLQQAQAQPQQLQQPHQNHHDHLHHLQPQQILPHQPQQQQAHPGQQLHQYQHEQQQQHQHQLQQQQQSQLPAFLLASPQFTSLAGGAQQPAQGYTQVQSSNGFADPSRAAQQVASGHQVYGQVPSANGVLDSSRGSQQMSAMQQGLLIQDWMWKSKSSGS